MQHEADGQYNLDNTPEGEFFEVADKHWSAWTKMTKEEVYWALDEEERDVWYSRIVWCGEQDMFQSLPPNARERYVFLPARLKR